MGRYLRQIALVSVLAVAFTWAAACSAARDAPGDEGTETHLNTEIAAVLESVPSETATRFILTVKPVEDSKVTRQQVDSVIEALRDAGAKAEWLEGSPVIFVTCNKEAIYLAVETGHVATVQVDRLRKPMD